MATTPAGWFGGDFGLTQSRHGSVLLARGGLEASDTATRDQKIEILRRWEYDARQLEVAEEKAEMAVRHPDMFDRVVRALHMLDVDRDTEHTPPTK